MSTDGRYRCCRFFIEKELDAHLIGGYEFFEKAIRENTPGEFLWWGLLVERGLHSNSFFVVTSLNRDLRGFPKGQVAQRLRSLI